LRTCHASIRKLVDINTRLLLLATALGFMTWNILAPTGQKKARCL